MAAVVTASFGGLPVETCADLVHENQRLRAAQDLARGHALALQAGRRGEGPTGAQARGLGWKAHAGCGSLGGSRSPERDSMPLGWLPSPTCPPLMPRVMESPTTVSATSSRPKILQPGCWHRPRSQCDLMFDNARQAQASPSCPGTKGGDRSASEAHSSLEDDKRLGPLLDHHPA